MKGKEKKLSKGKEETKQKEGKERKEKTTLPVMQVFTLCELGGCGHRNSIEWTQMSAGVQSHDPISVLDNAVLSFDARTLDGNILRHGGIIAADTCDSFSTTKHEKVKSGRLHLNKYSMLFSTSHLHGPENIYFYFILQFQSYL